MSGSSAMDVDHVVGSGSGSGGGVPVVMVPVPALVSVSVPVPVPMVASSPLIPVVPVAATAAMAAASTTATPMLDDAPHSALSEHMREAQEKQQRILAQLELEKRARTVIVPTKDDAVRAKLRELREPITLFGEGPADRRQRLRKLLAAAGIDVAVDPVNAPAPVHVHKAELFYTEGEPALRALRLAFAHYSIPRAAERLAKQKRRYDAEDRLEASAEAVASDPECAAVVSEREAEQALVGRLRSYQNSSSEIGDERPVSSVRVSPDGTYVATSGWSGHCAVWSLGSATTVGTLRGHRERCVDLVWHPQACVTQSRSTVNLASAGADGSVRVWAMPEPRNAASGALVVGRSSAASASSSSSSSASSASNAPVIHALATLEAHSARCARVEFHPSGRGLVSSSFDCTWKLHDLETQQCVLTQGGHSRPVYGLAFQGDGALLASTSVDGTCRLWDMRTGKCVVVLQGHNREVLSVDFHPDGYTLATGAEDNQIKIWDLRRRRCVHTVPAHNSLVPCVRFEPTYGRFLASASFDHTVKLWRTSDWSLIRTLSGHADKATGVDISPDATTVVSCSFDRTWKAWAASD